RDAWKAALAAGESVESPAGVLSLRTTASGRRRVHLEAASDLCCDAIEAAPQRHNMPPIPPNASSSAQCPRCGSQWFAQHEFHRYANQFYSATVGGSMYAISEHPQFARICLCGML